VIADLLQILADLVFSALVKIPVILSTSYDVLLLLLPVAFLFLQCRHVHSFNTVSYKPPLAFPSHWFCLWGAPADFSTKYVVLLLCKSCIFSIFDWTLHLTLSHMELWPCLYSSTLFFWLVFLILLVEPRMGQAFTHWRPPPEVFRREAETSINSMLFWLY